MLRSGLRSLPAAGRVSSSISTSSSTPHCSSTGRALCASQCRQPRRAFGHSSPVYKSATEAIKDTVKTVDRTVSDAAVSGIETGQHVTGKAKEAIGINAKKAEAGAQQLSGEAAGKAHELKGAAEGKASELSGKAKGAAEEVKHKI